MKSGRASRTAEHNALFRALETARRPDRRLFSDPFARRFLSPSYAAVAAAARVGVAGDRICGFIDRRWPGVRTSVVARTRLIDDAIATAVDDQTAAVVILGAGFDSRAYRLPCLEGRAVIEVDHPDTQQAKRRALQRVLRPMPANVQFVASDFNRQPLDAVMADAGLPDSARTLFLWEGVTNYLTEDAVDTTLRWCARAGNGGSTLIFTYIDIQVLTHPERFVGADRLFATLQDVDERLTFGLDPSTTGEFLAARGLTLESDIGAAEYRSRYFGAAARDMRGHEFYRVAVARVS